MTRGQLVIITNNGVFSSCEFNGDMYYEGYGKEAIERLKNVKTVKDFEKEVSEFNNENFQYNYDLVLKAQTPIDFSVDYFDNWFSDYLYIKNISNKANTIVDADGKSWKIKPNEIKVFYFGKPTNIKEKSIKEAKTVTCISCEKNLNDYRNDPTCTQTWDYADGDTKWYQKSIHACIEDAKKFMKKGYLCYIDGELFDKPDVFDDTSYFKMEIKPKSSAKKSIKESSDMAEKISSEIDKSYWIDKLIDDLDRHYESMEKAWLKNLDKLSDEDILGIIDDCMGKSKTLVGKSEMLKNKMIDDLSKAYDDYIDDIDRQIRIGKSEDEIKDMIETTLENDIKMYLKLAYNNKASSNYFMVKFAEDNLI